MYRPTIASEMPLTTACKTQRMMIRTGYHLHVLIFTKDVHSCDVDRSEFLLRRKKILIFLINAQHFLVTTSGLWLTRNSACHRPVSLSTPRLHAYRTSARGPSPS